jgi:DNA polymerase beta
MNTLIIEEFKKLIDKIKYDIDHSKDKKEETSNTFRLRQIQKVTSIIKKFDKEIKGKEELDQLKEIKGIGSGTIKRIEEILKKGKLSEIKSSKTKDKHIEAVEELEEVINIGRKIANKFITDHKIKSVKQLKKAIKDGKIEVNDKIKLGLKYHNKVNLVIKRSDIDTVNTYLYKTLSKIDNELFGIICGSYRRKKLQSSDIDVLITHPKIKTKKKLESNKINYLRETVKKLRKDKFIIDDLTDKDITTKYMGFCKLKKGRPMRIDIRYVSYKSYYPALLYFTGSGDYNKKMRGVAESLGYLLNEYGLYKLEGDKKKLINVKSEKDIFDKLGMEYLEPENR